VTEMKGNLFERQRVFPFLILLVTFLIKKKSDKRGQKVIQPKVWQKRLWEQKQQRLLVITHNNSRGNLWEEGTLSAMRKRQGSA
ncbi:MAG: hypothetical protein ACO1OQ_04505, partial [Rufibacter sp.]